MPHDEYVAWQRAVLTEIMRRKPTGALFYIHKWRVQNGLLQHRNDILQGFPLRQVIIWQRSGGINFSNSFFLQTCEQIYMIANPEFGLVPGANAWGDVWYIPQERDNPHPARFPIALVNRIIESTTAHVILDPFVGSGTTAVSAVRNGRHYIGIDLSAEYCQMARERLSVEW